MTRLSSGSLSVWSCSGAVVDMPHPLGPET